MLWPRSPLLIFMSGWWSISTHKQKPASACGKQASARAPALLLSDCGRWPGKRCCHPVESWDKDACRLPRTGHMASDGRGPQSGRAGDQPHLVWGQGHWMFLWPAPGLQELVCIASILVPATAGVEIVPVLHKQLDPRAAGLSCHPHLLKWCSDPPGTAHLDVQRMDGSFQGRSPY